VAHIVGKAAPRIVRSGVVDTETGGSSISDIRTSSGMFFERAEDPIIASKSWRNLSIQTR
jgi:prolyl 4-hydroxylase